MLCGKTNDVGFTFCCRRTIIEDVVKTQLAEYEVLFAGGESDAWLTKVDLRRKWFLKTAVEFEKTLAAMFPPSWQVSNVVVSLSSLYFTFICNVFYQASQIHCHITQQT